MSFLVLGLTIILMVLAVYLPFLQLILKTMALSPTEWGVVLLASLMPMI